MPQMLCCQLLNTHELQESVLRKIFEPIQICKILNEEKDQMALPYLESLRDELRRQAD